MQTSQVFATLDQRLLAELPRFFASFQVALGELLQNAYRAGANRVDITWNAEKCILVLVDDGRGILDPQALLAAGRTGWDDGVIESLPRGGTLRSPLPCGGVESLPRGGIESLPCGGTLRSSLPCGGVESLPRGGTLRSPLPCGGIGPAGLGFFAHLRPEWVEMTTVQSGDWTLTLRPEVLTGQPAKLYAGGQKIAGSRISLHLKEGREVTRDEIVEARAYYPLVVTFNSEVVEARRSEAVRVATSVGPVELETSQCRRPQTRGPVWEHRLLSETIPLLRETAGQHSRLAWSIFTCRDVRWFIDPVCGVRPKLPDRNALIEDDELAAAVTVLVDEVVAHFQRLFDEVAAGLPDLVTKRDGQREFIRACPGARILADSAVGDLLLGAGYRHICHTDITDVYVYEEGGGWVPEEPEVDYYLRSAISVSSRTLALSLNYQGRPASYDASAPLPKVEIENLRYDPEHPLVALADSIEVAGVGEIKFLIADSWEQQLDLPELQEGEVKAYLIYAGTVDEFIRDLHGDLWWFTHVAFLAEEHEPGQWVRWDGGKPEIDTEVIARDLILDLLAARAPDRRQAAGRYYWLRELQAEVESAQRTLGQVGQGMSHAGERELHAAACPVFDALGKLLAALASEVDVTARKVGLKEDGSASQG